MEKFLRSINWVMLMVYSFITIGLFALMVFIGIQANVNAALLLAIQFFLMGVVAWTFSAMGEGKAWKLVALPEWLISAFFVSLFVIIQNWMHPALFMAMFMFALAGSVMYARYLWKDKKPASKQQGIEWRPLGSGNERVDPLSAADAERASVGRQRE